MAIYTNGMLLLIHLLMMPLGYPLVTVSYVFAVAPTCKGHLIIHSECTVPTLSTWNVIEVCPFPFALTAIRIFV